MDDELFTALLEKAERGNSEDIRNFLKALLEIRWIVPRREQQPAMRIPPAAMESIADVAVMESEGELLVPIFSSENFVQEWSGHPLRVREFSWESLHAALPNSWWLCVNPGSELSKDISAWERELLAEGPQGLQAIVEELSFADQEDRGLIIVPLPESELPALRSSFLDYCNRQPEVQRGYLGYHGTEEVPIATILVGAEISSLEKGVKQRITTEITDLLSPLTIGGPKLSVSAGTTEHLTLQAIARSCAPIYQSAGAKPEQKPSGLHRILNFFKLGK